MSQLPVLLRPRESGPPRPVCEKHQAGLFQSSFIYGHRNLNFVKLSLATKASFCFFSYHSGTEEPPAFSVDGPLRKREVDQIWLSGRSRQAHTCAGSPAFRNEHQIMVLRPPRRTHKGFLLYSKYASKSLKGCPGPGPRALPTSVVASPKGICCRTLGNVKRAPSVLT